MSFIIFYAFNIIIRKIKIQLIIIIIGLKIININMKHLSILSLLLSVCLCEFPFPVIKDKRLYIINDIGANETFEIFFYKPTIINQVDVYFYENENRKLFLPGWQFEYYIIETGLLFQSKFIKGKADYQDKKMDVDFSYPIFLTNSTYGKHVYVDQDVGIRYKIWKTNGTVLNGTKYLSN